MRKFQFEEILRFLDSPTLESNAKYGLAFIILALVRRQMGNRARTWKGDYKFLMQMTLPLKMTFLFQSNYMIKE